MGAQQLKKLSRNGGGFLHSKSTEVQEGALQFLSGQFWRRWSVEHYRPFAARL
jgi:hypothetical protein